MRYLRGKKVTVSHGLQQTIDELDAIPPEVAEDYKIDLQKFLDGLISHYVLDEDKLVVAHAGLKEAHKYVAHKTLGVCSTKLQIIGTLIIL